MMSRKRFLPVLLAAMLAASMSCHASLGKTWTVEQRQLKLMQDINAAQKIKELTAKEAKKLRSDLSDVSRKKKKMLAKGNGTLTDDDKKELETDLNDVSANILKFRLEKRTQK
jgi:uncharacterized protein YlxW (UPF0749 family)